MVVRRKEVLVASLSDGQVLLDPESQNYVGLDQVGSAIWKRIDARTSVTLLCEELTQMFEGDPRTIEADTLRFLNRLIELNLAQKL